MATYNSNIILDGNSLKVINLTPEHVPGTIKQFVGKRLVKLNRAFPNVWDWELEMTVVLSGSDKETIRDNILSIYENNSAVSYTDGKHDGTYWIEKVSIRDTSDNPVHYVLNLSLTQKNQV